MPAASIARVLIDSPLPQLDRLFDYRIPEDQLGEAQEGCRVRVPLRSARRIADGFIVELVSHVDYPGALSELDAVVSSVPVLASEVYTLARKVADRAAGGASDIVRIAVPKRQVRVEKAWLAADQQATVPVTSVPVEVAEYDTECIDTVVADAARVSMEAVPKLVEVKGSWVGHWAVTMAALASRALNTGSVILVVPDYRDQAQLEVALDAVIPAEHIIRLDARQPNADRYRAHLACLDSTPKVILGNRSAIYAPAKNLSLVVMWNDGDPVLAEPLAPYVHSRDAALIRQEQQHCALVFLNHARTVEVERLVQLGWCTTLAPTKRYLPKVVPTAQQSSEDSHAARARIPSSAWREARTALESGPVLVQVARPGYAPRLVCDSCGQVARCAHCNGPLGVKRAGAAPSCSWCGAISSKWRCANCAGSTYRLQGQGATRTAEDLGRAFPGVPVIIADGERQILEVGSRPALVIATRGAEPIAAGGYRAVILLDGERMLARESLRVGEDCLRWWSNAIALAATGAPSVLVGVGGSLAGALATWQLHDFARAELADRRRLRFPPAVRVATVTGDTASIDRVTRSVSELAGVDVLGPVDRESGQVRVIIRFDFSKGAEVAHNLRAEVIRNATSRRKRVPATGAPAPAPTLRVRFDDLEPFEQL
jgi:primosomal protein N' (replication factor Y) (superfamily II helicase)